MCITLRQDNDAAFSLETIGYFLKHRAAFGPFVEETVEIKGKMATGKIVPRVNKANFKA